jgi:hypothetical protein
MSMSPCLHVCLHVSMYVFMYVSWSSCLVVSMSLCHNVSMSPCLHVHVSITENRTNRKRQLLFVFCKRKTETANFRLFAANENRKRTFVFLGPQRINGIDDCCFNKQTGPPTSSRFTFMLFNSFLYMYATLLTRSEIYNPRNPLASPRSQI